MKRFKIKLEKKPRKKRLKPFRPTKKKGRRKKAGRPKKVKEKKIKGLRQINSHSKGKVGELELAHFLKERGIHARRGQQFQGGNDSPDVIAGGCMSGIHIEVKRTEAGNPYNWIDQACNDADVCKMPVVAHRRNGRRWLAILDLRDFVTLMENLYEKQQIKEASKFIGEAMAKNLETIIGQGDMLGGEHAG